MKILHIDSSIQGELSVSRRLSAAITARLAATGGGTVVYRDLARNPLPQFSADVAATLQQPPPASYADVPVDACRLAHALDELLGADTVVLGAPMYNFSVPTQLKSWLDAIAVPGKTFSYGPDGVQGLLGDKRVIVASARGGIYSAGSPAATAEHHETYLRSFFGFLGVTRFEVIRAEGTKIGEDVAARAVADAMAQIALLEAA